MSVTSGLHRHVVFVFSILEVRRNNWGDRRGQKQEAPTRTRGGLAILIGVTIDCQTQLEGYNRTTGVVNEGSTETQPVVLGCFYLAFIYFSEQAIILINGKPLTRTPRQPSFMAKQMAQINHSVYGNSRWRRTKEQRDSVR